jgi:fumarate hydratase class I
LTPASQLQTPLGEAAIRELKAGEYVLLSGELHTARDAVHKMLAAGGEPPCDLEGTVLYHCGPVVVEEHGEWFVRAAGPTTSYREEPYMGEIIRRFGLKAVIGKGGMGDGTLRACQDYGCVYLHAVGGAAQVLARAVKKVKAVYLREEYGSPEAVWHLQVEAFPALVTMDSHGTSLHKSVASESAERLAELLA